MSRRDDVDLAIGAQLLDDAIDQPWINQRLIALDVDDERELSRFARHLGHPIGPTLMMGRGHDASGTKGPQGIGDSLIVNSDYNLFYFQRFTHAIDHMLDKRFAGLSGDNFGGKTGGSKSGRNDDARAQTAGRV